MSWFGVTISASVVILFATGCSGDSVSSSLGDRYAWCAQIQAVWDAEAETRKSDSDSFGSARWQAAGLIYSTESVLDNYSDEEELTAAIVQARFAYESYASSRTIAALEVARDASDALDRLHQRIEETKSSYAKSTAEAISRSEHLAFPPDATEAWFRAGIALESLIQAARLHADANEALQHAGMRASEILTIYGQGYDPAEVIYNTAVASGDWEAMAHSIVPALATARDAAKSAEDYAVTATELKATQESLIETSHSTERTIKTALDVAAQDTGTGAVGAYDDIYDNYTGLAVMRATIFLHIPVEDIIKNFEDAAWKAARIAVGIDTDGIDAFKDSLRESCR